MSRPAGGLPSSAARRTLAIRPPYVSMSFGDRPSSAAISAMGRSSTERAISMSLFMPEYPRFRVTGVDAGDHETADGPRKIVFRAGPRHRMGRTKRTLENRQAE